MLTYFVKTFTKKEKLLRIYNYININIYDIKLNSLVFTFLFNDFVQRSLININNSLIGQT